MKFERSISQSQDEIKALACSVEEKLERDYGVTFNWDGYTAQVKGPGLSGVCDVQPGKLVIDLRLGFLASAFSGKIEEKLNRYLDDKQV